MTLADTLRGLIRRWYIVVPGLLLAVAVAIGAFTVISPGYERSATRLLLPGLGTVPEGATNPYLFLGGLTQASDILVRAVGGDETVAELVAAHPGLEVAVTRDPTSSGPVVLLTATAKNDADAAKALEVLIHESTQTLERLQTEQNVRVADRITMTTLTKSVESTLQQRSRIIVSAAAGVGVAVLALVLASLVDGLARKRSRRKAAASEALVAPGGAPDPGDSGAARTPDRGRGGALDPVVSPQSGAEGADGRSVAPDTESRPQVPVPALAESAPTAAHTLRARPSVPVGRPGR